MKRPEMLNRPKTEGSFANGCLLVLGLLFVCLFLLELVFNRDFFIVQVSGGSMDRSLYGGVQVQEADGTVHYVGGDFLYAQYGSSPAHGDIVIIDATGYATYAATPRDEKGKARIIKRVIALGGDTVKCEGGTVYLKPQGAAAFEKLEEPYAYVSSRYPTPDFPAVTVGEGEVFVLGDHRHNSLDSEELWKNEKKLFSLSDIEGVVPEWAVKYKSVITRWENFRAEWNNKLFNNKEQ